MLESWFHFSSLVAVVVVVAIFFFFSLAFIQLKCVLLLLHSIWYSIISLHSCVYEYDTTATHTHTPYRFGSIYTSKKPHKWNRVTILSTLFFSLPISFYFIFLLHCFCFSFPYTHLLNGYGLLSLSLSPHLSCSTVFNEWKKPNKQIRR